MFARRERYGRDDGRDQGRYKTATFLCLRAFREIDGRDGGFLKYLLFLLVNRQVQKSFD